MHVRFVMQEYNINSAALHQLTCGIPDGTGRTDIRKGFYVHQKPQDFTINLLPGHNVVLGASKTPQLITESTLREKVVSPEIQSYPQADGSVRCRCTGWKEEPFSFCSQLLRATAAFPEHLTPYYANASTKKGSDKSAESQRTAEQGAAAAAATASTSHSCAAAKLHDDILVPDASGVSECMLSSQLGFRRWVFQVIAVQLASCVLQLLRATMSPKSFLTIQCIQQDCHFLSYTLMGTNHLI